MLRIAVSFFRDMNYDFHEILPEQSLRDNGHGVGTSSIRTVVRRINIATHIRWGLEASMTCEIIYPDN